MATAMASTAADVRSGPATGGVGGDRFTTERILYAGYLAVQTIGGLLLWVVLAASPAFRAGFELTADHPGVTDAFFWPDMLIVVASAASAWALANRRRWAVAATATLAGLVVYPTLYLVGYVTSHGGAGGVGLTLMVPTALFSVWIAVRTSGAR